MPSFETHLAIRQEQHDEHMTMAAAEDDLSECDACGHLAPRDLLDEGLCEGCAAVTP